MVTFLVCLAILGVGYVVYGKVVEKIVGYDDSRPTPVHRLADGVDYVKMPMWKVLLTQFLNIAGVGPIFGAIMGAMFGPIAFVWITLGCVFVGAVHDYMSGYVSLRHDGKSVSEIVGIYLGEKVRILMRVFSFILLMLVGVVFTMAPAAWLAGQTGLTHHTWIFIILGYYVFATIVPVNVLIARLFPILSILLLFMCVALFIGMIVGQATGTLTMQEFTLDWQHPGNLPVIPFIFVTIACGAVSGFHSTKSPMMARCMDKESDSKPIFFGAMILEGIVALVWAAVAMAVVGDRFRLGYAVIRDLGGQGAVVDMSSRQLIGDMLPVIGTPLAIFLIIIAIVLFPVTSGDTTFRSIRLMISDILKLDQSKVKVRLLISAPVFAIAIALTFIDFDIVWRYFAWSNLTLAAMALWTGSAFLVKYKRFHWISTIPAAMLTFISVSYILQAPNEGFGLPALISNIAGGAAVVLVMILFMMKAKKATVESGE